jgi:hypothetical protein
MPQNDEDGKPIIWMHVPLVYPFDDNFDKWAFPPEITSIIDPHERAAAAAQYELDHAVFSPLEIHEYKTDRLDVKFSVDYNK